MSRPFAVTVLALAALVAGGVSADEGVRPNDGQLERKATVDMLRVAIEARIAVGFDRRSGLTVPAAHCRHAKEGCDGRLREFALYIVDAGDEHGVDPWLMAAMAFRESGFNPFALGSVGEAGILQLHPGNPRAKHVRFLSDPHYRKRCQQSAGACQREVVDHAAQVLKRSLDLCGGDLRDALGAYNTGRCGGNDRYAKRILQERGRLLESVGLTPKPSANRAS